MRALMILSAVWLATTCSGAIAETVDLGEEYTLDVVADKTSRTVAVTLTQFGRMLIEVELGNAVVGPKSIQWVTLCSGCDPSVFVAVYDASSTYGATTGILAWGSWTLTVLPMGVAGVEDVDGDGIDELTENFPEVKPFTFDNGMLAPGASAD